MFQFERDKNTVVVLQEVLDEGIFVINYLKPKAVLCGRTPAAACFARESALLEVAS